MLAKSLFKNQAFRYTLSGIGKDGAAWFSEHADNYVEESLKIWKPKIKKNAHSNIEGGKKPNHYYTFFFLSGLIVLFDKFLTRRNAATKDIILKKFSSLNQPHFSPIRSLLPMSHEACCRFLWAQVKTIRQTKMILPDNAPILGVGNHSTVLTHMKK